MLEETEIYLATAWGDSEREVTMETIHDAIAKIRKMDDEHGAFWVSIVESEETMLETHKDLTVIGIFANGAQQQVRARLNDWEEIEELYKIFLTKDFENVQTILVANRADD